MSGKKIQGLSFTKLELCIVKYFFKHFKEKYTPRHLAKTLEVNHAHTNSICALLLQKGLLTKERIGNGDYYRFNYTNTLAIKFIEYLISLEEKELPKWLVVPFHQLRKFETLIEFGCIFGSSIHSQKHNDIDVLLVYNKKNSKRVGQAKEAIRKTELIEQPVRYVELTPQDIQKNNNDKVFYSILSECLVFCHAEKYVEAIKYVAN